MTTSFVGRTLIVVAAIGALGIATARHDAAAASVGAVRRHLALKKSEPKASDTLTTSPAAIKLWFTESVKAATTSIRVLGADAKPVALGKVTVDTAKLSPAVAKVTTPLKPGKYSVEWKALADDGHPTTGTFAFTVRPKAP